MRPNFCLTILCVFAALFLTLDADSEDSDCKVVVKVDRNTVYEALLGEDLWINCTVEFCNDSLPKVSWFKRETTDVPVNVSSSSHMKTKWLILKHLDGRLFLIFQRIRRNDSGVYQCQSGESVSHNITVSVHDQLTTVMMTTSKPGTEDTFWPFVYRTVWMTVITFLMLALLFHLRHRFKGKSRDTLSRQPSHDALPTTHVYDNDQ
ncbi:uncharacterized protein LOC129111891 [Anoplopoma fimbria]|uniref:uncharacterized protein LOC129111891 n=1 Tax=Anoplopoma fimbria TaxID=229290 RepID=UPI0023EBE04D|nr:uncharacterized protein LOC129111891 [Anoplopoma fimbria]